MAQPSAALRATHGETELRNKVRMPLLGRNMTERRASPAVGTFQMSAQDVETAVPAALRAGYRLFDTAAVYRNERAVGEALRAGTVARGDLFVTSKLQPADQGYAPAAAAIDDSLAKIGLGCIDLYLVHWPGAAKVSPADPENRTRRMGSWRALEEALAAGKVRAIGVSNYGVRHLREMEAYAQVMPMVNQIELHPTCYPEDVLEYCREAGIFVQAYSSLGRGRLLEADFLDAFPEVAQIAGRHGASVGQVLLRWALQHGFGLLPKSTSPARIAANADIIRFGLAPDEMHYLDGIHRTRSAKYCWDSSVVV